MIAVREKVSAALPALALATCVLEPILDMLGFWQQQLGLPNILTMVLRALMLAVLLGAGYLASDRKWIYWLMAGILAAHALLHSLACLQNPNGYRGALRDLFNLFRIYFLPLMTVCFVSFLRREPKVFSAIQRGLVIALLLIAASQLLSVLTGTDPHTYIEYKIGVLGWFLWTNSQSAVLSMLFPLAMAWAAVRMPDKPWVLIALAAIGAASLFFLAPRLAYASMVGAGLVFALALSLLDRKKWRQALAVALIVCVFAACYPVSPTNRCMTARWSDEDKATERIVSLQLEEGVQEKDKDKEEVAPVGERADKMEKLYRSSYLLWSVVEHFGRERVFEAYNYTLDPVELCSVRKMKLTFCNLLMEDSGPMSMLFGLNLNEMTHERINSKGVPVTENFDVENDFHGVYFLAGIVGLALLALFLLWFGLRALIRVLREPRRYFSLTMAAFGLAYGLSLVHMYCTACILRRTNSSIYLALVLAGLWFLSRKDAPEDEGEDGLPGQAGG